MPDCLESRRPANFLIVKKIRKRVGRAFDNFSNDVFIRVRDVCLVADIIFGKDRFGLILIIEQLIEMIAIAIGAVGDQNKYLFMRFSRFIKNLNQVIPMEIDGERLVTGTHRQRADQAIDQQVKVVFFKHRLLKSRGGFRRPLK